MPAIAPARGPSAATCSALCALGLCPNRLGVSAIGLDVRENVEYDFAIIYSRIQLFCIQPFFSPVIQNYYPLLIYIPSLL